MKKFRQKSLLAGVVGLFAAAMMTGAANASDYSMTSPDGNLLFTLRNPDQAKGQLRYSLEYKGKTIVAPSRIEVQLADHAGLMEGVEIVKTAIEKIKQTHTPLYGQREIINDQYTQTTFDIVGKAKIKFQLVVRAYDNGVAWRYIVPIQNGLKKIVVANENTEFRVGPDGKAWVSVQAQGLIQPHLVSQLKLKRQYERPLVVELPNDGPVVALGEAALLDSARARFTKLNDGTGVSTAMAGEASFDKTWRSPYRYVLVADTAPKLLQHGYDTIWCLNDPSKIGDTSFIKPGKAIREGTLSMDGARRLIDYCSRHNVRYCHFDARWYGPERDPKSDASTVVLKNGKPILEMKKICDYAKSKGVEIIVYVNRIALMQQIDELLPLYKKWGIAGIKFGFVDVGSQESTQWLHESMEKCAKYGMITDAHDEYRPTGAERTYPNFLTMEGVRGDEASPPMWMAINSAFIRNLCGPLDHTFCYFSPKVDSRMGNRAGQLAKSVVMYSPLQYLHWSDRMPATPEEIGEERRIDENDPALKFWEELPTTWDQSQILDGKISEYIVTARRKGATWFMGVLSAKENRTIKVPMSFLGQDQYIATIYRNDPTVKTPPSKVLIEKKLVTAKTVLTFTMQADDGVAIQISPAK